MSSATRSMACSRRKPIRRCRAPRRRATGSNSPRSSTKIGRSSRACCGTMPSITRPASRSRRSCRQDHQVADLQPGLRFRRDGRSRQARPRLAQPAGHRRRQDADAFEAKALAAAGSMPPTFRRATSRLTSSTSGAMAIRPAITPTSGPRCSTMTRSTGSRRMAVITRANGQRFRDMVLSRGNTIDLGTMYRGFTGMTPTSIRCSAITASRRPAKLRAAGSNFR